jgi:O-antigen/teichoic acid export membrane protein
MSSVGASVGNLGATSDKKIGEQVMRKLYFLNFWLLTCCSCVLVSCVNKFILLWLGEKMLFGSVFLWVVVSCFYFSCIRDPVQIFLQAYGIFSPTKFINPIRALVNILVSCLLIKRLGIIGVFAGTLVSTVGVALWCEVRMLYKYGFRMNPKCFVKEMSGYIVCSYGCMAVCFFATQGFSHTLWGTLVSAVASFFVSNSIMYLLYSKSMYFGSIGKLLKKARVAFSAQ